MITLGRKALGQLEHLGVPDAADKRRLLSAIERARKTMPLTAALLPRRFATCQVSLIARDSALERLRPAHACVPDVIEPERWQPSRGNAVVSHRFLHSASEQQPVDWIRCYKTAYHCDLHHEPKGRTAFR